MKKRQSGVLMHISSFLDNTGSDHSVNQHMILLISSFGPSNVTGKSSLGTTSYGDSPYQSFSAFAGNTHFIDLDILVEQGLLEASDLKGVDFGSDASEVDYAKIYYARRPLLEKAVKRFLWK